MIEEKPRWNKSWHTFRHLALFKQTNMSSKDDVFMMSQLYQPIQHTDCKLQWQQSSCLCVQHLRPRRDVLTTTGQSSIKSDTVYTHCWKMKVRKPNSEYFSKVWRTAPVFPVIGHLWEHMWISTGGTIRLKDISLFGVLVMESAQVINILRNSSSS